MVHIVYYNGRQAGILIGKETTWGTPVATTKDIGLVQSVNTNVDLSYTQTHTLSTTAVQAINSGKGDVTGSVEVEFQHGRLLEYATGGTVVHSEADTPDIKHTYALASTLPSFTMGVSHDGATDIRDVVSGVKVMSTTLALDMDGQVKLRCDLSAKDFDPSSTTADTAVVSTLANFKHFTSELSFGEAASEVLLTGVQSFEFTLNNTAVGEPKLWGMETRVPVDLDASGRSMSFRFSLAFQDVVAYKRFLGSTAGILNTNAEIAASGLIFQCYNNVAAASGRREIYLDLSNAYLTSASKPISLGGWILVDFEGIAKTLDSFFSMDNILESAW